jgi:hypothetical protein
MPEMVLNALIEKLLKVDEVKQDDYELVLLACLDVHKRWARVIFAYIGIELTRITKKKLAQADTTYERQLESLDNIIDTFISKAPIWKKEDEQFLKQIKSCFSANASKQSKVMHAAAPKLDPKLLKLTVAHILCLYVQCRRVKPSTDLLDANVVSYSNGVSPFTMNGEGGTGGYDDDDGVNDVRVLADEDPRHKVFVQNIPPSITSIELALAFRNCGAISEDWLANLEPAATVSNAATVEEVKEAEGDEAIDDDVVADEEVEIEVNADGSVVEKPEVYKGKKRGRKRKGDKPMLSATQVRYLYACLLTE